MRTTKLKWLITSSNAGEVIDRSHWGRGNETLYTCSRAPLITDFEGFPNRKRTRKGDLLLTRNGTPYIHTPVEGALYSNVVQRITVPSVNLSFLRYALDSRVQNFRGYGVSIESFNMDMWGELDFPLPDPDQQISIARHLDRETARIDGLIEKKGRFIALLKEQQLTFSDSCITGADRPDRQMKASRIQWAPSIPKEWSVKRGKEIFAEMARPVQPNDEIITSFRNGQVCLRSKRRTDGYTFAVKEVGYQRILKGDLVIHTMDAFAGAIGISEDDGKATGEYAVCTPHEPDKTNSTYYALLLRCMARRNYIYVLCPSVRERAPRFRFIRFAPVALPVPPKDEQDSIVERINENTERTQYLISKTERSIALLREKRAALITAAVTGKIDVRSAA